MTSVVSSWCCCCLQGRRFDLVVSGINRGDNCGLHVIYSGTVGAAREAACKVGTQVATGGCCCTPAAGTCWQAAGRVGAWAAFRVCWSAAPESKCHRVLQGTYCRLLQERLNSIAQTGWVGGSACSPENGKTHNCHSQHITACAASAEFCACLSLLC